MKTKIVGVTYDNPDGTNRQNILRRMKDKGCEDERLTFVHEKNNPRDPNAVMILNKKNECLGYLKSDYAESVAAMLDDGLDIHAYIINFTGGTASHPAIGCNINIPMIDIDESREQHDKAYTVSQRCTPLVQVVSWCIFGSIIMAVTWGVWHLTENVLGTLFIALMLLGIMASAINDSSDD